MVYALVGIPLTGMLLAVIGDALSRFMLTHFESKISLFGEHKKWVEYGSFIRLLSPDHWESRILGMGCWWRR